MNREDTTPISNFELIYKLKLLKARLINSMTMDELETLEIIERRLNNAEY